MTILELDGSVLEPRYTNQFGRYRRLLVEGTYTLMVQAHGYETHFHTFVPSSSAVYDYDVQLNSVSTVTIPIIVNKPDNYDLPISLEVQYFDPAESQLINSFAVKPYKIDTLAVGGDVIDYICYNDHVMKFTPLGDYLYPETKIGDCSLFQSPHGDLDFDLVYEGVLFHDDFSSDNNWSLNDNWHIENGHLISRSQEDLSLIHI